MSKKNSLFRARKNRPKAAVPRRERGEDCTRPPGLAASGSRRRLIDIYSHLMPVSAVCGNVDANQTGDDHYFCLRGGQSAFA
jgi:hypothetical protein